MKEITILSGKGGTGKTSITAAIASVSKSAVFCDNDVDAADLHLIFHPKVKEEFTYYGAWTPSIDKDICTECGLCMDHCRFDAIHMEQGNGYYINPFQCEGCRLCERICPEKAIESKRSDKNRWFISSTRMGTLVHARMGPGEENSGKLVTEIRKKAKEIALENNSNYIISDGPPGIGCATISSLSGTDMVLMVIEPSKTGMHDAERLLELVQNFNIQTYAVINKSDINPGMVPKIKEWLTFRSVPLLGEIPFTTDMVEAMIAGKTIVEYQADSSIVRDIQKIWKVLSAY